MAKSMTAGAETGRKRNANWSLEWPFGEGSRGVSEDDPGAKCPRRLSASECWEDKVIRGYYVCKWLQDDAHLLVLRRGRLRLIGEICQQGPALVALTRVDFGRVRN